MSRTYDRLIASSAPVRLVVPVRVTRAWSERWRFGSEAEIREFQWAELAAHYTEHQSGPLWVLMRGGKTKSSPDGHSELIHTQQCLDCERYGRGFDQYQSGRGISDVVMEIWR